ncbi:MAG: hypothetical protein EWV91_07040 [Microcystis aeruginosa Ma_QC_Ca_00000000_S207]|uniref:Uncharacterized protein n=1 Tax=Microcystis aeruginosa Ma_QC_Ca_00000000_S207 TaxID=2486251 RepID=A0A552FSY3_MICAE|nr:MAG: hypothetical protein EWV91_07040 [Microcystis aeruginosa Ma_QC_Ca_00000000_S207]
MLKEQVISQQVSITRKAMIRNFELRLPRHAKRVIGLESGVRMVSALPEPIQPASFAESLQFIPSRVMGELRLQHIGKSGLFFSTQVMEQDSGLAYGDFSMTAGFKTASWTHQGKREPFSVQVDREASILLGMYKDIIGEQLNRHLEYQVLIHLWFETKEEDK